MKSLLIALNAKYIHSNPAVYSLRAYSYRAFKEKGISQGMRPEMEIAEYTVNQPTLGILSDIYGKKPEAVFFSCYIWNIEKVKELTDNIRKIMPETEIWLGGPEVSFAPCRVLKENSSVDGIICGEGEETFFQVVSALESCRAASRTSLLQRFSHINGIIFRNEYGDVIENSQRKPVELNDIPFLYEDVENFRNRIIYYESSRGCPFRCSYCLSSIEKSLRFRNIDIVKKELLYFIGHKVKQVKFVDRTFNCDRKRAAEIWKFIAEHDNGVTNFHFEISGDMLSDEEMDILEKLRPGSVQLEIGVQSVNMETLREINRKTDLKKLKENVGRIREAGNIHIHLDLIAGLPFENMESFKNSFNEVYAMRPHQLQLGFLKVLKGTVMEKKSAGYGIRYTSKPPYEVLGTEWLDYDDIRKLKGIEEMVECYYNSGQFVSTLNILSEEYENPFEMFENMAEWYEENGLAMMNISRNSRYEYLIEFARVSIYKDRETKFKEFEEAAAMDYYSRENAKNRPLFLRKNYVSKEEEKTFYRNEERIPCLLKDMGTDNADARMLRSVTHIERIKDGYVIFDYTKRDAVTGNVRLIRTSTL